MNLRDYPLDTQTCVLEILSCKYNKSDMVTFSVTKQRAIFLFPACAPDIVVAPDVTAKFHSSLLNFP